MKVALLIEKFGALGGAERQIGMLARTLADRGHSVHVIASEVTGEMAGVTATALGRLNHVDYAKAAKKAVEAGDYDLVHSFTRTLKQDILRLGGGVHAEYLKRMESTRSTVGRWFSRINPKEKAILNLERKSFQPEATRVIQAVSNQVRDEVVRHYSIDPKRIIVMHNTVDVARFTPAVRERRPETLKRLEISKGTFVVLFVGSGFRRKGLARAIQGLPKNATLVVAGGGSTVRYERMAKKFGADVRFVGPRKDIEAFYGAADALVLPTQYDPFPNVTLEAMACGVPVIVTKVAGVSEIIADGIDSFVVDDPGDPGAIKDRLSRLMLGSVRDRIGKAARALAERHPYENYLKDTLALYESTRR